MNMGDFSIALDSLSAPALPSGLGAFLGPFPVVLWCLGLFFYALSRWSKLKGLEPTALVFGVLGCLLAWPLAKTQQMTVGAALPGFSGAFLLPLDSEKSQTALVFSSFGWGFALLVYLVEVFFLRPRSKATPSSMGLLALAPMVLSAAFVGLGFRTAFKTATADSVPPEISNAPVELIATPEEAKPTSELQATTSGPQKMDAPEQTPEEKNPILTKPSGR